MQAKIAQTLPSQRLVTLRHHPRNPPTTVETKIAWSTCHRASVAPKHSPSRLHPICRSGTPTYVSACPAHRHLCPAIAPHPDKSVFSNAEGEVQLPAHVRVVDQDFHILIWLFCSLGFHNATTDLSYPRASRPWLIVSRGMPHRPHPSIRRLFKLHRSELMPLSHTIPDMCLQPRICIFGLCLSPLADA